jgi:crotonobetainyl-CoA:carnitine CoA-transferase CaiB-like acyl-CoA transferase
VTTSSNQPRVLDGIRVLDLSGLPGQYTGRLLADMGADVVKVEPPGGDPVRRMAPFAKDQEGLERSLRWLAYNTNKRSVVIDLTTPQGQAQLKDLVRTADILLETFQPGYLMDMGLGHETLRAANPRLITISVTPFGESGPYSSYRATDLHAIAMSGLMYIQGDNTKAPATAPGDQPYIMAAIHAAHGAFYALMAREKTGRGQHVEVSVQEVLANIFFQVIRYSKTSEVGVRTGVKGNLAPYNIYQCKDGWVSLAVLLAPQAKAFFEWIGDPVLQEDFWYQLEARRENQEFVDEIVRPFVEQFTVAAFVEEAQKRRLPAAPVNTPGAFADNPQFAARGYFVELDHPEVGRYKLPGAPFRMSATPLRVERRAPLLGEDTGKLGQAAQRAAAPAGASNGKTADVKPLQGIRVLDFTRIWAGPYSTRHLADFGAEVIKVESSLFDTNNRSGSIPYIADLNRNKLGMTLDLHKKEALDLAKRLVAVSDVVIDNFALGVIDRFGLGYEELKKINPDIIQVSMPGWGSVGPLKDHVAFGFNLVSVSGLSYSWGHPDSSPAARCKFDYPDFLVAGLTTLATLAAIFHKTRTGVGQYIEVAQAETVGNTLGMLFLDYFLNGRPGEPRGNRHLAHAPHGVYPCKGADAWCAIAVTTDEEWQALRRAMGDPAWARDAKFDTQQGRKANEAEIEEGLAAWTAGFSPRQVMHLLQRHRVSASAVFTSEDLYWDMHLRERGYIVALDHPDWGRLEQPNVTVRLSDTPGDGAQRPSPALGEHNGYVLRDVLNLSAAEVHHLQASGALK